MSLNGDLVSCRGGLPVETLPMDQHTYCILGTISERNTY